MMDERAEWEKAQFKPSDFTPLGLKLLKAFFILGITVPMTLCLYGLVSYCFPTLIR